MKWRSLVVGSESVLATLLLDGTLGSLADADVVLVTTAAAFTGSTESAVRVGSLFEGSNARVEGLMANDRAACDEAYFATRVRDADVVVLLDGSPLHARATWRDTALGRAIEHANSIIAIGAVATVLGEEMIDPRGGAPTTGLGYRPGAVLTTLAAPDQMERTRQLIDAKKLLLVVPPNGSAAQENDRWRVVGGDVSASRGTQIVDLES